jgi:hypothetical protein
MMRRRQMLTGGTATLVLLALGAPALAKEPVEQVMDQLRKQGFGNITVQRTLLGRARILAERGASRREIILNPRTGEILRDLWLDQGGSAVAKSVIGDDTDSDDDNSGKGGGSDDDDDKDDDDSDDDDSGGGDDGDRGGDDD